MKTIISNKLSIKGLLPICPITNLKIKIDPENTLLQFSRVLYLSCTVFSDSHLFLEDAEYSGTQRTEILQVKINLTEVEEIHSIKIKIEKMILNLEMRFLNGMAGATTIPSLT